jgi:hypothetical protein
MDTFTCTKNNTVQVNKCTVLFFVQVFKAQIVLNNELCQNRLVNV